LNNTEKIQEKSGHSKGTSKSHIWGVETPKPTVIKICLSGIFHDVITHANFGKDRLKGFGMARGRILGFFPLTCAVAITTLSHYLASVWWLWRLRGNRKREIWHRETIKIVVTDIARLDNSAPYSKGGHCETCFSVRVDAHYKFMFDSWSIKLYELLIGFMFVVYFFLFYLLLRADD